jgi:hypothetical protein
LLSPLIERAISSLQVLCPSQFLKFSTSKVTLNWRQIMTQYSFSNHQWRKGSGSERFIEVELKGNKLKILQKPGSFHKSVLVARNIQRSTVHSPCTHASSYVCVYVCRGRRKK